IGRNAAGNGEYLELLVIGDVTVPGFQEGRAMAQRQLVQCHIQVHPADEARTAQDVFLDPSSQRAAEDQDELSVPGEVQVPGGPVNIVIEIHFGEVKSGPKSTSPKCICPFW